MSTAWVECWKCDECGHRWIKGEIFPTQCASSKCRKRSWNRLASESVKVPTETPIMLNERDWQEHSIKAPATKPTMGDLRAICAGELESEFTGIETIVKRDGTNIHQAYNGGILLARVGNLSVLPLEDYPGRLDPQCRECSSPMRSVKGKWACADQSCPIYGKEQKIK